MTKLTDRFHGDLKIRHTAYTSGHEVSTALLGKHITAGFQVPANILPYANSGDFNVIAISRKERLDVYKRQAPHMVTLFRASSTETV